MAGWRAACRAAGTGVPTTSRRAVLVLVLALVLVQRLVLDSACEENNKKFK